MPPTDEQQLREELVAYLDGELDEPTRQRVEQWLARDPSAREELRRLEETWLLLDELPRAETDETFTQTTVEMIALTAAGQRSRPAAGLLSRLNVGRLAPWWLTGVWFVGAALVGFLAVALARPDADRQLLEDLPLLEHLDAYRYAESVEFLRHLAERELFANARQAQATSASGPSVASQTSQGASAEVLAARRQRIEQMTPDEQGILLKQRERFEQLPDAERRRLRELYRQIEQQPDAERLRATMLHYYQWLTQLEPLLRAEIASLEPSERLDRVERLRRRQQEEEARRLSADDLRAVGTWLEHELIAKLPAAQRRLVTQRMKDRPWQERSTLVLLRLWKKADKTPLLNEAASQRLAELLSDDARRQWEAAKTLSARRQLMTAWIRQLNHHLQEQLRSQFEHVSDEELAKFFDSLSIGDRDRLMSLPPEEMQRELRLLYLQDQIARRRPGPIGPGRDFPPRRPGLRGDARPLLPVRPPARTPRSSLPDLPERGRGGRRSPSDASG